MILAPQARIFLESSLCVWLRAERAPDRPTCPFPSLLASCGLALTRGLCMPFLTPSIPSAGSSLSPGGPSQAWGTCRPNSTAGILRVLPAATRDTRQAGFSREAQGLVFQPEARFQAHKLPSLTSLAWPLTSSFFFFSHFLSPSRGPWQAPRPEATPVRGWGGQRPQAGRRERTKVLEPWQ